MRGELATVVEGRGDESRWIVVVDGSCESHSANAVVSTAQHWESTCVVDEVETGEAVRGELGQEDGFEVRDGMCNDAFDLVLDGKQGRKTELLESNGSLPIEERSTIYVVSTEEHRTMKRLTPVHRRTLYPIAERGQHPSPTPAAHDIPQLPRQDPLPAVGPPTVLGRRSNVAQGHSRAP